MQEVLYDTAKFPEFARDNTATGILKVQVSGANQAFPLPDVEIEVWKEINGEKVEFYKGVTDSSGIIDNIILPAKESKKDISSASDIVYTSYILTVTYPKTNFKKDYNVGIFDNIKVIQPVRISVIPELGTGDFYG